MVTSKGAAAVSGGSFVVLAATVTAFGVRPLEGLALLFGLYRFYVHGRCRCHCDLCARRDAIVLIVIELPHVSERAKGDGARSYHDPSTWSRPCTRH